MKDERYDVIKTVFQAVPSKVYFRTVDPQMRDARGSALYRHTLWTLF